MTAEDLVKPVEKHCIEVDIRRALDLMDCASCAAEFVGIAPGCPGIVAALLEASNILSDVMDALGITKPEAEEEAAA